MASWPCRLASSVRPLRQHGEQLVVGEVREGGHRHQVGVDPIERCRWPGRRRRCAAGRLARRRAGGGPAGEDRAGAGCRQPACRRRVRRGRRRPSRRRRSPAARVRAPSDGMVPESGAVPRGCRRASESARGPARASTAPRGTTRRPVPARRPVPVVGGSVVIGRACRRWSVPSPSTAHSMSCGPPYVSATVTAAAWRAGGALRPAGGRCHHRTDVTNRPVRSRTAVQPLDLAGDECGRVAGDSGEREAVGATGDGIGAEQHAAEASVEHRLHEHRHVGVDETGVLGGLGRGNTRSTPRGSAASSATSRIDSNTPAIDDVAAVLAGRRRADDDLGRGIGGEEAPCGDGSGLLGERPVSGEHDAGKGRESGRPGGSEIRGLGARHRRVEGGRIVERHDGWERKSVHGRHPRTRA